MSWENVLIMNDMFSSVKIMKIKIVVLGEHCYLVELNPIALNLTIGVTFSRQVSGLLFGRNLRFWAKSVVLKTVVSKPRFLQFFRKKIDVSSCVLTLE